MKPAAKSVATYIQAAPATTRGKLRQLRNIIKTTAPQAEEKLSYGMPYYGYKGRLAYFAHTRAHIGLYVPPPVIAEHKAELKSYGTSLATVRFPLDKPLPIALIKKLIKARVKKNEEKSRWKICSRGHKYQGSGPCPTCWPGYRKRLPHSRLKVGRR